MVCVLTMAVFYSKVLNYQRGFCLLFAPKNGLLDFCFKKILERTQYAGSLDPNFWQQIIMKPIGISWLDTWQWEHHRHVLERIIWWHEKTFRIYEGNASIAFLVSKCVKGNLSQRISHRIFVVVNPISHPISVITIPRGARKRAEAP